MAIRTTLTLWQPPEETIEAIASVLGSRWSAARSQPSGLFGAQTTSWLQQQARRLADNLVRHTAAPDTGLTTSPEVAGSSDKHPDRHPC